MNQLKFQMILFSFLISVFSLFGQDAALSDSALPTSYLHELLIISKENAQDNAIITGQNSVLEKLKMKMDIGKSLLASGFDSATTHSAILQLDEWNQIASEGILDSKSGTPLEANILISSIILNELLTLSDNLNTRLNTTRLSFEIAQRDIDSLSTLDILYKSPKDTALIHAYLPQIITRQSDAITVSIALKNALTYLQKLQSDALHLRFNIESNLKGIEKLHQSRIIGGTGIETESGYIHGKNYGEIITWSMNKVILALGFYISNHFSEVVLAIFSILLLWYFLVVTRKTALKFLSQETVNQLYPLKHSVITATVSVCNIFLFLFENPPFVFYGGILLLSYTQLAFLLHKNMDRYWARWFIILGILFLVSFLGNLLLLHHRTNDVIFFALAALSLFFGWKGLRRIRSYPDDKLVSFLKWFLVLFITIEGFALLLGVLGYTASLKRLSIAGLLSTVTIITMVSTMRMFFKMFVISMEIYKRSGENTLSVNSDRFTEMMPRWLFPVAVIGWIFVNTHYFYLLHLLVDPFISFFSTVYNIGSFTFTFGSIILLFGIIFLSTIIARILSFMLSESDVARSDRAGKSRNDRSSWVLLLKIGIISLGIIIAFAAAGIPFDKITIIISALSVGIGFGMQTLINNLVSGLIIAFEKPIRVDDVVEVAGKNGRMKSIGIRSSIVSTWDGSDVIIPNGDLLNQHLTNWTLGNTSARFEIVVGVAYGTNLGEASSLIHDLITKTEGILKYPAPSVLFSNFGDSAISISIRFWVPDYASGLSVKSKLIIDLDTVFREHKISIPFPQQDVFIKNLPPPLKGS